MEEGHDFLKAQVNNAVAQHNEFCKALEVHKDQADDNRYKDLCARYYPKMRAHQEDLERYQESIGAGEGVLKRAIASTVGAARNLADMAREDDFLRLVNDIVMSRQAEDTFRTFREAGRELGDSNLERIGEQCIADHEAYAKDANRLVQQLFVANVREGGDYSAQRRPIDEFRTDHDIPESRL